MVATQAQSQDLAVVYAALLLTDAKKDVSAANLQSVTKAAGVTVDKSYIDIYAKFLTASSVESLVGKLSKVGATTGAAPAASSAPAAKTEEKKAEPVKKEESESEGDMGFGLFG